MPIEITNHYNPDEYDETPEDYSDDLTGYTFEEEEDLSVGLAPFVGCWKYDEEPFYLVIGDDYELVAGVERRVAQDICNVCRTKHIQCSSHIELFERSLDDGYGRTCLSVVGIL